MLRGDNNWRSRSRSVPYLRVAHSGQCQCMGRHEARNLGVAERRPFRSHKSKDVYNRVPQEVDTECSQFPVESVAVSQIGKWELNEPSLMIKLQCGLCELVPRRLGPVDQWPL